MVIAFCLLSISGTLGAFDVLYFHIYRCRLYRHPDAVWENITHFLRAFLFAVFFITVMHLDLTGTWWWGYVALSTVEIVNSMIDTLLEPSSRKKLGGLPDGEYYLHNILSVLIGAIICAMLWSSWPLRDLPTGIHWRASTLPLIPRLAGYWAVVMALAFFAFEASCVVRMLIARRTPGAGQRNPQVAGA